MKQKELLLWVVAIGALVISLVAVIGPRGLKSDAARMQYTVQQQQAPSTLSDGTAKACHKAAEEELNLCMSFANTQALIDGCRTAHSMETQRCNTLWAVPQQNSY